ncbi:hypothetical protein F9B85_05725 [Heliorestis acidaminivorans]|uniref:Phospholipid/glycerol acyltransferase domain-containing protein n=1 Tax=Heliorestis acidaminivorans TaxID=553427 RepID=A0A6I0F3V4_9FIRM|nr:lysophospholipid acyltransferase family protein [Heliorestis acidaminivorans]KAB2953407.1 hypothetical protein F9B85_05725 [Heliorestis acidaminivorans]
MIESSKNPWFNRIFYQYNLNYLLRRHFHAIYMRGEVDPSTVQGPMVYMMNHSSWWDGLLVYHVTESCSRGDHYLMMDEAQMSKYRFFRRLGAFSINKKEPREILKSLAYAVRLLEKGASVWIFPQGDIYPLEKRPLHFQSGIGHMLRQCIDVPVLPVTLYYSLCQHQKTEASIFFGAPVKQDWSTMNRKDIGRFLEVILESQLDEHRQSVALHGTKALPGFSVIMKASPSTNERFDSFLKMVKPWKH